MGTYQDRPDNPMPERLPQSSRNRTGSIMLESPGGVVQTVDLDEMSEADRALAARFGYKPVFKREFGYLSTFSFAISIGGLFSSVATTFIYPLEAGGSASIVWCTYPVRNAKHLDLAILMTSKAGLSRVPGACALQYVNRKT